VTGFLPGGGVGGCDGSNKEVCVDLNLLIVSMLIDEIFPLHTMPSGNNRHNITSTDIKRNVCWAGHEDLHTI
jgi:hypothetical protein